MTLKYVGAGFVPGVPARDLTAEEVEGHGGAKALIAIAAPEFQEDLERKAREMKYS